MVPFDMPKEVQVPEMRLKIPNQGTSLLIPVIPVSPAWKHGEMGNILEYLS